MDLIEMKVLSLVKLHFVYLLIKIHIVLKFPLSTVCSIRMRQLLNSYLVPLMVNKMASDRNV